MYAPVATPPPKPARVCSSLPCKDAPPGDQHDGASSNRPPFRAAQLAAVRSGIELDGLSEPHTVSHERLPGQLPLIGGVGTARRFRLGGFAIKSAPISAGTSSVFTAI